MKKIVALLLALVLSFACVFALASCGECEAHVDTDDDHKCDECGADYIAPVDGVTKTLECYANSLPSKVVSTSKQEFYEIGEDGEKFVAYDLDSETVLVTGKVNGLNATVETTTREILRAVGEVEDILGAITTTVATDEYLEGSGRRTNGTSWNSRGQDFAPTLGSIGINITKENALNATYTESPYNNVLSFTISKDAIKEVFGAKIDITTDTNLSVTITNDGAVVTGLTIQYGIKASGNYPERIVKIAVTYDYNVQKVTLVK